MTLCNRFSRLVITPFLGLFAAALCLATAASAQNPPVMLETTLAVQFPATPVVAAGQSGGVSQNASLVLGQALHLQSIAVPANYPDFSASVISGCTIGGANPPLSTSGTTCVVAIHFAPLLPGPRSAPLIVTATDSGNNPIQVNFGLTGLGQGALALFPPGTMNTLAGGQNAGFSGDGSPASGALLNQPTGIAIDPLGDIFVADSGNGVIRRIDGSTGVISTIAGIAGVPVSGGDGGPASKATFVTPLGLALDAAGNLYIADTGANCIRRIDAATGIITTVAGNGVNDDTGDGGLATAAAIGIPRRIALDAAGDLFITQTANCVVREVAAATGKIGTLAGGGCRANNDDGVAATQAQFGDPEGITLDGANNVYISDKSDGLVYEITINTMIVHAIANCACQPVSLAFDPAGNLDFADTAFPGEAIWQLNNTANTLAIIAGDPNKTFGFFSDGGPATLATLWAPNGVAVDGLGEIFIGDTLNNRIRKVSALTASTDFASVAIGQASTALGTTLLSAGNVPLAPTVALAGANASDFKIVSNTCGASLAVESTCTAFVNFTPAAGGARQAALTIASNASNSPQSVTLTGFGSGPGAELSSLTQSFASQTVGTSSAAVGITLTNNGAATLTIASVAASGDFSETNNCPAGLAANANCLIQVTFKPTTAGARTGTLTITDNAANSPQTVALSGTGAAAAPIVGLSPSSLTFAAESVGTTSPAQTVTLSNSGTAVLALTSITASGDFAAINNCGASLAAGSNCAIQVTFTPTAAGNRTGALSLADNAAASPQTVALIGTGNVPQAVLSPATLNYANQTVGIKSAAQTITLTNSGTAPLAIASITASGDFAESNTCSASLAPGANCPISVTFTPTAVGSRAGTLMVTDNAAGSPHTAALTGTGIAPAPAAALSPATLSFGNQPLGVASASQTITLANGGTGALAITSVVASGDFVQTNNCGASLPAAASCAIQVIFDPTASGSRTGTLMVSDNASPATQTDTLGGTGVTLAPAATLSPTTLNFASQIVSSASAPQAVTLTNSGNAALAISSIASNGDFSDTTTCAATLAAAASCTIQVTFTPTVTGNRAGTLTIADNGGSGTQILPLTGSAQDINIVAAAGSSTTLTVVPGAPAQYTLTLTPAGGFSGNVSLACAALPANTTIACALNPTALNLTGTAGQMATVTVSTTAAGGAAPAPNRPTPPWEAPLALLLVLVLLFAWRHSSATTVRTRRRTALAVFGAALWLSACGGNSSPASAPITPPASVGTAAGTYTINVTATATNGTRMLPLTLIVN